MTGSRLLRLIVAVVLTAVVLFNAHPAAVLRAASDARLTWIGAALALVLADRTLMALRWIDLLGALTPGSRPPFPVVLRVFFVSSFVSNFVPSVAADMYRAYALARHDVRLAESTASVLMDRVIGVLSMVMVGTVALAATDVATASGWALEAALAAALAACAAAAVLVFSERGARLGQQLALRAPWARARRAAVALTDAVRRHAGHRGALARVLVMSVLVQVMRILQAWCLGRSLGIELPLAAYFAFIPVILLVMQLPITINGFGTTQLAFDRLFVPAGVDPAATFALSVLFLALGVAGSLPGGLLYALSPGSGSPGARPRVTP